MKIKNKGYQATALIAVAACCLFRADACAALETKELLLRAEKQLEAQYFSPEATGMKLDPAHRLFLESTLSGISKSFAAAESAATGELRGRINFQWLATSARRPVPVLYAEFSATILENGIVEGVRFTSNNLREWTEEIDAALSEHKKSSSTIAAAGTAAAALKQRGFANAVPVPVISWEEGIATGLPMPVWNGFSAYAFSADSSRAKIGIRTGNAEEDGGLPAKNHYFTVELSIYDPVAGKWTKAEVVSEEIWEGFKPQGRKTGFSAARYFLW